MEDLSSENSKKNPKHERPPDEIAVFDKDLTFNDFFKQHLLTNQPCIIKNVADDWNATKHWLTNNKTNINFKYLCHKYATCPVLTYDCNKKFYNSHKTEKTTFIQYLQYWQEYRTNNYSAKYPLLYLKDWHLKNTYPTHNFYKVPPYFTSDWLNEYLVAAGRDDYRFVYMGPKGSWTPFHADVFKSYSWSVNILGRKRWIFLPPGGEEQLKDRLGNLPHEIVNIIPEGKHYDIIQEAGDAIFVPSGWYHQVINMVDTISINHNWVNGCNINLMLLDMQKHLDEVKKEIADCRGESEFQVQCQIVLKASYGMDFIEFLHFVTWIAEERMKTEQGKPLSNLGRFDLRMINEVLGKFVLYEDVKKLDLFDVAKELQKQIETSLAHL